MHAKTQVVTPSVCTGITWATAGQEKSAALSSYQHLLFEYLLFLIWRWKAGSNRDESLGYVEPLD
jgi:hypothetical protein